MACPQYLLISSKHRIGAEKDYNLWTDFSQIFRHYAMTNKFLPAMEMKLMPCSQQDPLCYTFMISIPLVCRHHPATHQHTIWSYSVSWATISETKIKLLVGFHILFIVYLQSAPFTMLEPLTCHVGAMYNKSIFSCICQVMKTPQWYVYAAIEILNSERN